MPGTPLRLLHAIHDFLPLARAGSEIYTSELCREFQTRGHHVTVVCAAYDPAAVHGEVRWRSYRGLPVAEIVNNWTGRTFDETWHDPLIASRLGAVLHAVQPEVVHVHNLLNLTLNFPAQAQARGAAVVATLHDYTLVCPSGGQRLHASEQHLCRTIDPDRCARCFAESPFGVRLAFSRLASRPLSAVPLAIAARAARTLMPRAVSTIAGRMPQPPVTREDIVRRLDAVRGVFDSVDRFVAPSAATAGEFATLGIPGTKLCVSDYGFRPLAARPRIKTGGPLRVGFVGTLVRHKGVHVLIDAVRHLPATRVELIVVGDTGVFPDYVAELRAAAAGLPVRFAGGFEDDEVGGVYEQFDALVVPSVWLENSPLVIHEAFMAGVPVIGSRIGGIPGLVEHDVTGLLFEPGDAHSLAAALRRLLDEPSLLGRLASAAPRVKSVHDDAREWEETYRSVLDARAAALHA